MNQDCWKLVNRIFDAALELEPGERDMFVATQCKGDMELQAEVASLLQADGAGGSFLHAPLIPDDWVSASAPAAAGDVLCHRFHIVREIGEGGMGYVFEATDLELSIPVAVKMIRPELAPNREAIARFRQEVRLALTITHPNVCRTFDIERETRTVHGKRTEVVFLTMEFLRGETLATRIARDGRLPEREALEVARQIAAALQAAHSLGVIHRDIKPTNIMLADPGAPQEEFPRVVVTDFGLAQLDPALRQPGHSTFSKTGHPVGTLAYMAPEQLEGGPVSPATDLYALGLVLFETMTGERVFPSSRLLSGIGQRMHGSIALKHLQSPAMPANWRRAIACCLAADPAARPQSAADVIAMLEQDRRWFLPRLAGWHALSRLPGARIYPGVAALLIAVALWLAALRLYPSSAESRVSPGALVYLTQVKNETGEKSMGSLTELIRASLSQSTQVTLLDQARAEDVLQQMTKEPESAIDAPSAREVALRTGAVRVVLANVTESKGKYSLQVEIQQPDSTPTRYRERWTKSFSWQSSSRSQSSSRIPAEALKQVRSAADWIRHEAGESANDIARLDTPPEDATTADWEALESYSQGERLARARDLQGAITELQMALKIDPHFALANALLGDLEVQVNHSKEGFAAYGRALDLDVHQRLSLRERDRIQGLVAHDNADFEGAEAAYREYTWYYPNDYLAWFRRGRPLLMLDRPQESSEVLTKAHTLDPSRPGIVFQIVRAELVRGDLAEVNDWLDQLKLHHPASNYLYELGQVQFVMGDYSGAAESLQEVSRAKDSALASSADQLLADLHAEKGEYQAAIAILDGRLRSKPDNPVLLIDRAHLECRVNQFEECLTDLRQVLASDGSPRRMIAASAIAGDAIHAAPGAPTRNLRQFLNSLEIPEADARLGVVFNLARHRIRGEQMLAQRRSQAALAEFLQADALDAPFMARDYLSRALAEAATGETDAGKAQQMRARARACLAKVALHPAVVWQFAPNYAPGFYADQLEAWLRLPGDRSASATDREAILQALEHLRPTAARRFQRSGPGSPGRPPSLQR